MGVFEKALENIAFLRAEAGGSMSRLNFAADSIAAYTANMRAAVGRIEDVDITRKLKLIKVQHSVTGFSCYGRSGKFIQ